MQTQQRDQEVKPRIIGGICEFCGVPAERCPHHGNKNKSLQLQPSDAPIEDVNYKYAHIEHKVADIIIPHHNRHDHLYECLSRLPNNVFNIIVVSGGTFAENCNKGALLATTENIIILNDDTLPNVDALFDMCERKEDIVGAPQIIPQMGEQIFYGIGFFMEDNLIRARLMEQKSKVHIPSGFMFRVKKKAWEKLQGLDEQFQNGGEDSDFGLRALEKGMSIGFIDRPTVHKHSQSEGRLRYHRENQLLLESKWPETRIKNVLKLDPSRRLNILLTNNHLARLGGSETFVYTMYEELKRRGHHVDVYTRDKSGIIGDFVQAKDNIDDLQSEYDLILVNHNSCLKDIQDIKGYKIFTSHGAIHKLEQPIAGADKYVAISEEVEMHMKELGFNPLVIRNGIDCERFKSETSINIKPLRVLALTQGELATYNVRKACQMIEAVCIVPDVKQEWDIPALMNSVDLVVTLGRGAYEAMACGRAVIIYDSRNYMDEEPFGDGIVEEHKVTDMMTCNFSGRRYKRMFGIKELIDEMQKYKQSMGETNRALALKHFDIREKVNAYLSQYADQY